MPVLCLQLGLLAATMFGLHGCMSSPADQLGSVSTPNSQKSRTSHVADNQSTIADQAAADAKLLNSGNRTVRENRGGVSNPDIQAAHNEILAGRKNINAAHNSIYANPDSSTVDQRAGAQVAVNADGSAQPLNAAQGSIYAGTVADQARDSTPILLPSAQKVGEIQDLAMAGMDVPEDQQQQVASAETDGEAQISSEPNAGQQQIERAAAVEDQAQPAQKKSRTLADFFNNQSGDNGFDRKRYASATRRGGTRAIPNMQTAALGNGQLPGVSANAMFATEQHYSDEDMSDSDGDDEPGQLQLASLSGMTRVAPNGLWTQTDKVDVRCLRPQLVGLLKSVEDHYKRPVVVTSGYRDPTHNRRAGGARHSLHTLCAAADIQVQGVSKWALADYLRSLPGRGGVGTYCHTESVHVDIGGERDWNWRCRRKSRRGARS